MRKTHIRSGLLLVLLSVFCLAWLIPENTAPAQSELDLSPALVPSIAMGCCLVLATVMLVRALAAGERESRQLDEEFGEEATGLDGRTALNVLAWAGAATLSWLVMDLVGFEPAMTLFLAATMLFVGARNPWVVAAVSLAAPIVLSQVALHLFSTELPAIWR